MKLLNETSVYATTMTYACGFVVDEEIAGRMHGSWSLATLYMFNYMSSCFCNLQHVLPSEIWAATTNCVYV